MKGIDFKLANWFALITIAWANLWCCCNTSRAAPISAPAHHCCDQKQAPEQSTPPVQEKGCAECPFLSMRQNMLVARVVHVPPAMELQFAVVISSNFAESRDVNLISRHQAFERASPSSLFQLHTSLRC